jgi:hypothetical protein
MDPSFDSLYHSKKLKSFFSSHQTSKITLSYFSQPKLIPNQIMKLVSVFTIAAYATVLVSGWRLEVGQKSILTISGDGDRRCSIVDGDDRNARSHHHYSWHGDEERGDRRGERRKESCCVKLYTSNDCKGRGNVQEICDRGDGQTSDAFVSFSVDCKR